MNPVPVKQLVFGGIKCIVWDIWRALLKSLWKRLRALGRSIDSLQQEKGLVTSRYPKIYSGDRQHAVSMLWIAVIRNLCLLLVDHHSNSCRHWSHPNILPSGYRFKVPVRIPWMVSRQADILVCALCSRPGLLVPTLFVMHDVSLTPTKKVAWWQQLLIWWILYLLWVEWDGALLYCKVLLAARFTCDSVVCPI